MEFTKDRKVILPFLTLVGLLFCFSMVVIVFLTFLPHSVKALTVVPITDDTSFILSDGDFASATDDYDLLILREGFCAGPLASGASCTNLDLSSFPAFSYITGNPPSFSSTNDFVQSILVRTWDGGGGDTTTSITVNGTITFKNTPPGFKLLGVITDLQKETPDCINLFNSDNLFHDPTRVQTTSSLAAAALLHDNEIFRSVDTIGYGSDTVQISGNTVAFNYRTSIGADDMRIIIDYGDGLTDFPAGVTMDVKLSPTSDLGIHVGPTDFREAVSVVDIPLTGTSTERAVYPSILPDDVYFAHTRGRDMAAIYGGDDDNNSEYYVVINRAKFQAPNTRFNLYIFDADNNAVKALYPNTIGDNDVTIIATDLAGDTIFEYRLYGGFGASNADDPVSTSAADPNKGNPPARGLTGPADDYDGVQIDINPDCGGIHS